MRVNLVVKVVSLVLSSLKVDSKNIMGNKVSIKEADLSSGK